MDNLPKIVAMGSMALLLGSMLLRRRRGTRRWNVRPINRTLVDQKPQYLYFEAMFENDPEEFFRYTRMSRRAFSKLKSKLEGVLSGSTRRAVPVAMKLAITLQFLTQGTTKRKEAWVFQLGKSTVIKIVNEVTTAIVDNMLEEYIPKPNRRMWENIAARFEERWNVPNVLGALDGKHVTVEKPPNSGRHYWNYKKSFSIILMAVVDADYKFVVVDVGSYGSEHDSGAFRATTFGNAILNDEMEVLDLPPPRKVWGLNFLLPYFLIGDDAFPLKINIMKPFSGKGLSELMDIFNYRISRARRVVESAFGILAARFRIFKTAIIADIENVETYVLAACILHNFIITEDGTNNYIPPGFADGEDELGNFVPGDYRKDTGGFQRTSGMFVRNFKRSAAEVRRSLAEWFVSSYGCLEWQWRIIKK